MHVHGYNFVIVNFRKLVEVLLNCICVASGGPGDKKHCLSILFLLKINSIAVLHYVLVP